MLNYKTLTRRQLLATAGGSAAAAALYPLVPRLEAAEGNSGKICRYSYWYECVMPSKDETDALYQNNYGDLAFKGAYTPMNANDIKNDIIFMRNISRPQADNGGGPHPTGSAGYVGWPGKGKLLGFNNNATSIDQFLSQRLAGVTPIGDLRIGYFNEGKDADFDKSISVNKGSIVPRYQSPLELYNDVFKDSGGGTELLRRRRSVLDNMLESISKLKTKVSHFDNNKIQKHNEAVRATENKLEELLTNGTACSAENPGELAAPNTIYPIYSDLMVLALSCDMTRVAGTHYGSSAQRINYNFLPGYEGPGNYHNATHGKHSGRAYRDEVLRFRAQQVTSYLRKLKAVEEPDGSTLLDNTMFFWSTDVARGHDNNNDQHCIMAGAKDRLIGHGKMVNVSGHHHGQLLASVAHFMGYTDVDGYGDPKHKKGILPSSVFR